MEFNFSTNNSMTEFETPDSTSTIYLGFASRPETNIFSQKYFRSPHASTTESLIKKLELLEIPKKYESQIMMHLVQGWPTLDVSTALFSIARKLATSLLIVDGRTGRLFLSEISHKRFCLNFSTCTGFNSLTSMFPILSIKLLRHF